MTYNMKYTRDVIDAINNLPDCPNGYSDTYDKDTIIRAIEDLPPANDDMKSKLFRIGEVLVDVSKCHITAETGIEKIRTIMCEY